MTTYNPSDKDKTLIKRIYDDYSYMRNLRNQKWKYFNDRNLKEFVDDSQLRLNGYTPSRASQGKEEWQSNIFDQTTKNKAKALLADVSLDMPQVRVVAQNEKQQRDTTRAEIMRNLIRASYSQDNIEEQNFFKAWEMAEKGTIITYDGYLKAKAKKKIIKSYDPSTGEVETEEQEVETDNQCVNIIVPLMNIYIKDWHIFDIQKQPSLCWVERMDVDSFEIEFGKYPNAKNVKTSTQLTEANEADTFFKEFWQDRAKEDEPIEVVRYFNKGKDEFVIIANGVKLFESPLLLGKKKKWYPFSKGIYELFATDFFYGNSLPNVVMDGQDSKNALKNMMLDKTYKSLGAFLLIGNTNKDDFDLEDQNTTIDTKIYVQDINQVKSMPFEGVNASEIKMLDLIARDVDLSSVDQNQQGIAGRGVTAREVVIANENAKKMKGIFYLFLTSLRLQETKLRIMNVLTYFTKPKVKSILGEDGTENKIDEYQSFLVENTELSNGQKGTMGIQMVGSPEELPEMGELDKREAKYRMQSGENYETIALTSDYLDDWIYDIKIESESIYQKESGLTQAKMEEKLRVMGAYFPQLLQLNTEKLFKDTVISYEDDPDEYELTMPAPVPVMPGMESEQPGQPTATAGQAGMEPLPPM